MSLPNSYHAHVYYDENSYEKAVEFFNLASDKFSLKLGNFHKKSVGPHCKWNCSFTFSLELFGEIVPWLAMNRQGLSVLVHSLSGDDYKDHTDNAIWMGKIEKLKTEIFLPKKPA